MKKDIEFNGQDLVNSVESFAKSLPMRPLKFRVWDNVNKRFYPQNILNALPLDVFLASEYIQQYTGLKDSKDNEIYEGDILQRQNTIYYYKVEYSEKEAAYICRDCNGDFVYLSDFEYIVIGNEYEWPCKKPGSFDGNGECVICDGWATDCPCYKLSKKLEIHSDKPLMGALNTNYKLDVSGNISDSKS